MIIKTFSALTEPTKGALEPVQKLNQQAVAAVEKLAAHQLESLKTYSDMGIGRLKAAAEVKDMNGLQNFLYGQTDVLRAFGGCARSDIKAVAQACIGFVSQNMPTTKVGAKAVLVTPEKTEAA